MNLPVNGDSDEGVTGERGTEGAGQPRPDPTAGNRPADLEPGVPTGSGRVVAGSSARPPVTRRKLDEVFGDVLPSTTSDERDDGHDQGSRDNERWYRDNRPPHHG
jgi:hypothetical protein